MCSPPLKMVAYMMVGDVELPERLALPVDSDLRVRGAELRGSWVSAESAKRIVRPDAKNRFGSACAVW